MHYLFEYTDHDTDKQKLLQLIKIGVYPDLSNYSAVPLQSMNFNNRMIQNASPKKLRAMGCAIGSVIGEALGMKLRLTHLKYEPIQMNELITEMENANEEHLAGQYANHTCQSLCVADSLIVKGDLDLFDVMLRFNAYEHCGYNNCYKYDDQWDQLNDSLTQTSPICLAFVNDIDRASEHSKSLIKLMGGSDIACNNAEFLTKLCVNLINKKVDLTEFQSSSNGFFSYDKTRVENNPYIAGSYSSDTIAVALHCVCTTGSFKEALIKAINFGGDANRVGAITGQIAGALYGYNAIPLRWLQSMTYWNQGSILYRSHLLFERRH